MPGGCSGQKEMNGEYSNGSLTRQDNGVTQGGDRVLAEHFPFPRRFVCFCDSSDQYSGIGAANALQFILPVASSEIRECTFDGNR
jgi:hypothetical protein